MATDEQGGMRWYSATYVNVSVLSCFLYRVEAMRRKPWHWPNHVELVPSKSIVTEFVSNKKPAANNKMENGSNRSRSLAAYKNHLSPGEGTTSGAKIISSNGGVSVQKSVVDHQPLNFSTFVRRPLFLEDYHENPVELKRNGICQKGYPAGTISPCQSNASFVPLSLEEIPQSFLKHLFASVNDPVYELSASGEPFDNILQLRAMKISNFLRIPESWETAGFAVVPYERLLESNGVASVIEQIANAVGRPSSCPSVPNFEKKPYNLSQELLEWVNSTADWVMMLMLLGNHFLDGFLDHIQIFGDARRGGGGCGVCGFFGGRSGSCENPLARGSGCTSCLLKWLWWWLSLCKCRKVCYPQ